MIDRRSFLTLLAACCGACAPKAPGVPDTAPAPAPPAPEPAPTTSAAEARLAALERSLGGRVGVFARDTASGDTLAHRADERFAMCSTFKWALAAAVLASVDRGEESLTAAVPYGEGDLLDYAPTTREHLAEGRLTVEALCEAAVTLSDNTAANLLLDRVGGPPGLTAFLRAQGDDLTRLDRDEPTLNENAEGDPRDTTTPRAMATTLQTLALGSALAETSRDRLVGWLKGCRTCDQRLWAGLPDGWTAGTKTGTCNRGACNDVGLVWPASGPPIVVAAYLSDSDAPLAELSAALATVGRVVAARFA